MVTRMQTTLKPRRQIVGMIRSIRREHLLVPAGVLVGWLSGKAVVTGGTRGALALAVGGAALGGTAIGAILHSRIRWDIATVELPALLVLMSELVFRQRDADSLASNPLDPAGLFRVASIGLALLLGLLALTAPSDHAAERVTTRPFRLYLAYIAVVFVGAPLSVNLPLTAYRGVELLIGAIVVAGAYRRAGRSGVERILTLIYHFIATSAILIWLEALAMPGAAFKPVDSPFPIQLHGVFPLLSSNSTGTIGAILGLWSLARLLSPRERGSTSVATLRFLGILGLVTLVFAQYRTGTIIAVIGLLLLVGLRAKATAFWLVLGIAVVVIAWGPQIVQQAEPIVQRGENPQVLSNLSGRLNYWSNALPVWRESPLFGRGLLTATRFEVLAKLGSVYTSSIHGTWVEALVGTGLVGLAFLASSVLITTWRAFREARRSDGLLVPLLLVTILLVRSITGPTFEVAGSGSLMLVTVMMVLRDRARPSFEDLERESLTTRS
jgi:O-antigen ligase